MKQETSNLISNISTEEDLKKFNKFEFNNKHKIAFFVYYNTAKCYSEHHETTSPLKAFRLWRNKKSRCGYLPSISVNERGINVDFSSSDLEFHDPANIARSYQYFLDRLSDNIAYVEETNPGQLTT